MVNIKIMADTRTDRNCLLIKLEEGGHSRTIVLDEDQSVDFALGVDAVMEGRADERKIADARIEEQP